MQCQICRNNSDKFYCANCIRTSPQLAMTLRFKLLTVQDENKRLNKKIDNILNVSMDKNGTQREDISAGERLLKTRMRRVNDLKMRKKNGQLKIRISNVSNSIDKKRMFIQKLKQHITDFHMSKINPVHQHKRIIREHRHEEDDERLKQVQIVLTKRQRQNIESLNQWFVINKTSSMDIPYTLLFQPVISTRTANKLPPGLVKNSIFTMFQYLKIRTTIQCTQLPYPTMKPSSLLLEEGQHDRDYILRDIVEMIDETVTESIVMWLTKLTINMVYLCQVNHNLPSQEHTDPVSLLEQFDVDGLFYSLYLGQLLPLTNKSQPNSYIKPTHSFQNMFDAITDLLED
ncbi:similar to Saccharomyces cerevisiae YBR128C ATG14 Autophagy-specific subunit of phosphatidylinositol 3-kinase complex I (with Vps34/15/30p) [Maudiozyma barnettii]|uniref:Autophagy-related protein 14 n=1 Tax=Maudiozyma barnettii TaxID=61262 RepID=A0A8H2ZFL6_9SACH|nr:Atg14p [Kazachstania barnettii]CAB4251915.1 similar to Saccharomyces cerevisiae YBR128C ATG14 Autophagy-specific subunit of phosphatidylinositol 3-kinase complex I (with Vps34/15/30p) [Kazachstania barnettii]CAD1778251.1 similar to Saccharomyces cerevisiae YBR128C ATG14 Autophagy-specific subunit of phosphatidylinositol 3-kinase complex I (with Vps34/15/30p) [Kazachstania barnettii]